MYGYTFAEGERRDRSVITGVGAFRLKGRRHVPLQCCLAFEILNNQRSFFRPRFEILARNSTLTHKTYRNQMNPKVQVN